MTSAARSLHPAGTPSGEGGEAFGFGKNWKSFLRHVDEGRIRQSQEDLSRMLGVSDLRGRTFLDVGSGSGLSSLAAVRLGAERVFSFDYDRDSVECTEELRRRFAPQASHWTVGRGSVLDRAYVEGLGRWDVVYSWGVLHHTGDMARAFENVCPAVAEGGTLFVSIYNDQGRMSRFWTSVKRLYNRSAAGRALVLTVFVPYFASRLLVSRAVRGGRAPVRPRGMSPLVDWVDWLGGYPFEVAKPEQVLDFFRARGFVLDRLRTCGGTLGCNEFVFTRGT